MGPATKNESQVPALVIGSRGSHVTISGKWNMRSRLENCESVRERHENRVFLLLSLFPLTLYTCYQPVLLKVAKTARPEDLRKVHLEALIHHATAYTCFLWLDYICIIFCYLLLKATGSVSQLAWGRTWIRCQAIAYSTFLEFHF